ncbi:hypothetical protein ACRAWD_29295 [Caulobacter segnis]
MARLTLAADYIEPDDIKALVADNVGELDAMLRSLSDWLRAQRSASAAETVDLAPP